MEIINRLDGAIRGRNNYRPKDRQFLAQNGNCIIRSISVYRKPVQSFIKPILDALSLGQFSSLLKQQGYDKLFHLYMCVAYITPSNAVSKIKLEKNEVISISPWQPSDEDAEHIEIYLNLNNPITISQLLSNTQALMGSKFFPYSAFNNNCQNFVLSILEANKLSSESAKKFIYQDMTNINQHLDTRTKAIANGTTNLASRIDVLLNGKGLKRKRIKSK